MIFWILSALFSLAAILIVVYPVLRQQRETVDPRAQDKTLYEARIAEIDRDTELGRLSEGDAEAAKSEVARKLIQTQRDISSTNSVNNKRAKSAFVLSAIFVPAFTIAIYSSLGTPPSKLLTANQASDAERPASIQTMLVAVEKRLETNPDDARGWAVIAPVYERMGRYDEAINAYENLIRISGRKAEFTFGIGEALMSKAKGVVTPPAFELFKETVELDPSNAVAGFYIGVQAMQEGNNAKAISIWQTMVKNAEGNEDWLPTIRSRIAELQAQSTQPNQTNDVPLKTDEQIEMIQGMVSNLETRLEDNPDDQEGWIMLIRSYRVLGREEEALQVIEKARDLYSDDQEFDNKMDEAKSKIKAEMKNGAKQ